MKRIRTVTFKKARYFRGFFGEEFILQEKRWKWWPFWCVTEVHPVMIARQASPFTTTSKELPL